MNTLLPYLAIYLLILNLFGFGLMGYDKGRAKAHAWRVPEATLFFTAILGGSVGALLGMYVFRHKTKHLRFTIGMPAILIIQIGLFIFAAYQLMMLS